MREPHTRRTSATLYARTSHPANLSSLPSSASARGLFSTVRYRIGLDAVSATGSPTKKQGPAPSRSRPPRAERTREAHAGPPWSAPPTRPGARAHTGSYRATSARRSCAASRRNARACARCARGSSSPSSSGVRATASAVRAAASSSRTRSTSHRRRQVGTGGSRQRAQGGAGAPADSLAGRIWAIS